jgi:uncharacterized NAD-dependent epimerase/dehydratase family protein
MTTVSLVDKRKEQQDKSEEQNNSYLVEVLDKVAKYAKEGKIEDVCVVAVHKNGDVQYGFSDASYPIMGAIEVLKVRLHERWRENA